MLIKITLHSQISVIRISLQGNFHAHCFGSEGGGKKPSSLFSRALSPSALNFSPIRPTQCQDDLVEHTLLEFEGSISQTGRAASIFVLLFKNAPRKSQNACLCDPVELDRTVMGDNNNEWSADARKRVGKSCAKASGGEGHTGRQLLTREMATRSVRLAVLEIDAVFPPHLSRWRCGARCRQFGAHAAVESRR